MFSQQKLDLILRRHDEIGEKLSRGADGQAFVALSRERKARVSMEQGVALAGAVFPVDFLFDQGHKFVDEYLVNLVVPAKGEIVSPGASPFLTAASSLATSFGRRRTTSIRGSA